MRDFLVKNVHKDLQVKSVKFMESLGAGQLSSRTSYIKVEVGSKRQAKMVRSGLRKTWLHDCLIKAKTSEDAKAEAFDNRTVIINGLPRYLRAEQIIEYFGSGQGAVVGIELPMQNTKLAELRRKVEDLESRPNTSKKLAEER